MGQKYGETKHLPTSRELRHEDSMSLDKVTPLANSSRAEIWAWEDGSWCHPSLQGESKTFLKTLVHKSWEVAFIPIPLYRFLGHVSCRPSWPWTCHVAQGQPQNSDLSASFQACSTMPDQCGAGDQTQGIIYASQSTLPTEPHLSSNHLLFWPVTVASWFSY